MRGIKIRKIVRTTLCGFKILSLFSECSELEEMRKKPLHLRFYILTI